MKNKVVLVGAPGVGKTFFFLSVTRQYSAMSASDHHPTIGATYGQLQMYVDDRGVVSHVTTDPLYEGVKGPKLDLWDTAGQERYSSLLPMYLRNAIVAVVMHDNDPRQDNVERAAKEVRNVREVAPHAKIFVVQTKSDLRRPFNYKFVRDVDADGWAYITTVGDDLTSVDNAILSIAKLAGEVIGSAKEEEEEEEETLQLPDSPKRYMCCK